MSNRKIFITGANGYVGRNLLKHFVAQGAQVTGLVRNDEAAARLLHWGAVPVIDDVLTADLAPMMKGAGQLIHAAASLDHGPGPSAAKVNIAGTRRVLAAARAAGIRKILHMSTDSVLQDVRPLRQVNETLPYPSRPAGTYSASKAEAERIARRAAVEGQDVVILRPRMVWGRDDGTAMPTLVKAVKDGRFAWISGGGYLSSSTHIANLCHAVELALVKGRRGEIYHIADSPARMFRETVSGLLATQGLTVGEKSVPRGLLRVLAICGDRLYKISGGRVKGPLSFQEYATSAVEISLDIDKARRQLGYAPLISWEEGLAEIGECSWSRH